MIVPARLHIDADPGVTIEAVAAALPEMLGGATVIVGEGKYNAEKRAVETTGSAVVDVVEVVESGLSPHPANLPSEAWMEAVARRSARAAFAYMEALATSKPQWDRILERMDEGVRMAVKVAMKEPPPADDGGPSDPITAVGKAATEEARRLPAMPPEAVATTLVETMRHEPWKEPDAAEAWQLLAGMCILEAAQAMIATP